MILASSDVGGLRSGSLPSKDRPRRDYLHARTVSSAQCSQGLALVSAAEFTISRPRSPLGVQSFFDMTRGAT